jgi:hypothetical protein
VANLTISGKKCPRRMSIEKAIIASKTNIKIYLTATLPTNIIAIQLEKRSRAVDKSAGAIKKQMIITGKISGKKALLKSFIFDCFEEIVLAR